MRNLRLARTVEAWIQLLVLIVHRMVTTLILHSVWEGEHRTVYQGGSVRPDEP